MELWGKNASSLVRAALFALLGLVLLPLGFYLPGSPIQKEGQAVASAKQQEAALNAEVVRLRSKNAQRASLERQLAAAQSELESLEARIPPEKDADDFIRMLQKSAASSGVGIVRITSKPVVRREFHSELPFEMEAQGPFFGLENFVDHVSRMTRITTVGDVSLAGLSESTSRPRGVPADSSVKATLAVTTYFIGKAAVPVAGPSGGSHKP